MYTEKDVLTEWLMALLYIKCKANFELRIVLLQRNVRIAVIEEVLETIPGVRQTLQSRHAKVKIDWTYRGNWSNGKNCSPQNSLVTEMDDFYVLPRKTWKMNMMQFLIQVGTVTNGEGLS
jgi:hypothetical protein